MMRKNPDKLFWIRPLTLVNACNVPLLCETYLRHVLSVYVSIFHNCCLMEFSS